MPARRIVLLLEMCAGPERLGQISGIDNLARNHQQGNAARHIEAVPIFGDDGVGAVGNSIPAQISGLQFGRYGGEGTAARSGTAEELKPQRAARTVPRCRRYSLPVSALALWRAKVKETRLSAGLGFHLERGVVLPGDVQPPWDAQKSPGSESFALVARGFVLCRIPGFGKLLALGIQRDRLEVALGRRSHAITPILGDKRNPIPCQIYWSSQARWRWRSSAPALRIDVHGYGQRSRDDKCPEISSHRPLDVRYARLQSRFVVPDK